MNEARLRLRVGLFVLGTLVLLGVLTILFSRFSLFLKAHDHYTVVFDQAPGVGPGTPVRRSGIPIGQVRSVRLDDETGKVYVDIDIDRPHKILRGDQPTLARGLISGDPTIDFVPPRPNGKPPDTTPVPPDTELAAAPSPDMRDLLGQTQRLVPSTQETLDEIRKSLQTYEKLAPELERAITEYRRLAEATQETIPELRRTNQEILATSRNWGRLGERLDVLLQTNEEKLVKALDNFNETVSRVGSVFNDENQRNLAATLRNVRAGSDNLESITKNTDALVTESRQTVQRVNQSVTQTDEVLANLQRATRPMADRSASIMKNLDEATDRLNRTLAETQGLLRAGNQGDGTLQRFLSDPSLYNNLNDAACILLRTMPRVDRALHDIEVFADKIARHPESLGVGGVVKPSAGLKEAPSGASSWPRHVP